MLNITLKRFAEIAQGSNAAKQKSVNNSNKNKRFTTGIEAPRALISEITSIIPSSAPISALITHG